MKCVILPLIFCLDQQIQLLAIIRHGYVHVPTMNCATSHIMMGLRALHVPVVTVQRHTFGCSNFLYIYIYIYSSVKVRVLYVRVCSKVCFHMRSHATNVRLPLLCH